MRFRSHFWWVGFTLALFAAGCGSDSSGANDDDTPLLDTGVDGGDSGTTEPECTENAECGGGELCVEGQCRTACLEDGDCPSELPICSDTLCVECDGDGDCGDGESCVDNACTFFCESNSDCSGGEFCTDDGECVPIECTDDADCEDGEICNSEFTCEAVECTENADCAGGELCNDGTCVSITGGDCTDGEAECLGDFGGRTCVGGEWDDFACAEGICLDGECVTDGVECQPRSRSCDGNTLVLCDQDGVATEIDCLDGEICVDGSCEEGGCSPGETICQDPSTVAVCNSEGTAFEAESCAGDEVCRGGECVSDGGGNGCGGDMPLPGEPGTSCGVCGEWVCAGDNFVQCEDAGPNACGGCEALDANPGEPCENGFWNCDGPDALVCGDNGGGGECSSDTQCQQELEAAGYEESFRGRCGEGGCYTAGRCGPDDPIDGACAGGSFCSGWAPPGFPVSCVNCDPSNPSSCRDGEECVSVNVSGFPIQACLTPEDMP